MGYLQLRRQSSAAYGYLERLLKSFHPDIDPLPDLLGLCTQIDNAMTEIKESRRRLETAGRWFKQIRDYEKLPETSVTNQLANDAQEPLKMFARMALRELQDGDVSTTESAEHTE
ncbi:MAG: hypothetical protein ABFD89_16655 [Bryobacteraceae bacterium]